MWSRVNREPNPIDQLKKKKNHPGEQLCRSLGSNQSQIKTINPRAQRKRLQKEMKSH